MDYNLLEIIKTDCTRLRTDVVSALKSNSWVNSPEGQALKENVEENWKGILDNLDRLKESADDTEKMPSRAEQAKNLLVFIKEEVSKQGGKPITITESKDDLLQILAVPSYEYLEDLFEELEEKDWVRGDGVSPFSEVGERKIEDINLTIEGDQVLNRWTT